nr:hypothetical protein [uncultured Desulfobulbus sp.]
MNISRLIFIFILWFILSPLSVNATGTIGTSGTCYFVVVYYGPTSSLAYGYYAGGTSTTLGLTNIARTGGSQYSYSASGTWYYVNARIYYWTGTYWQIAETLWSGQYVNATIKANLDAIADGTAYPSSGPPDDFCQTNPCLEKAGTSAGYAISTYSEDQSPNLSAQCFDGCQVTAEIGSELGPCLDGSCVSSVKYTYSGESCTSEETIADLEEAPPGVCYSQWISLVNKCGSASNIGSFDYSSCSGECSKTDCSSQWSALSERCGGEQYIVNWDGSKCSGTCKTDDTPNVSEGDAVPTTVKTSTTTNDDGTSSNTTITTYNIDGTEYTTTTTTNYDSDGNATGTTTTQSQGSSDDETFSTITPNGFTESYSPSDTEFDIPDRFTDFLTNVKSSGLFSFSSDFFNSLPSGGSSVFVIEGGDTFGGSHSIDLSETMTGGLAVAKAVLLALFGFLSIRAIIMKR